MNAIEVKKLTTKKYGDFFLNDISFNLPEGCIMGVSGSNGSGKTMLFKSILGLTEIKSGEIRIWEKVFAPIMKNDIGIVDSNINTDSLSIFSATELDYIMTGVFNNWSSSAFHELLERFKIPARKSLSNLSFGQQRKLFLSIALSHSPKLLLIDEGTIGFDEQSKSELFDVLNNFTKEEKNSILYVSNQLDEIGYICDYVTILNQGELILTEEKDKLIEKYCSIVIPTTEVDKIQPQAVIYKKQSTYKADLICERDAVPQNVQKYTLTVDELIQKIIEGKDKL